MLRRLLVCLLFLMAATPVSALNYTDIYYVAGESGYGFNVVQSDGFMFVTFFVYGPSRTPTWYSAELRADANGNFTGPLYATSGSWYGNAWDSQSLTRSQVGTASFLPTNSYTATFSYTVTTPPAMAATATKTIQRQTLTAITLSGTYFGGQSGVYSGCGSPANNGPYTDAFDLQVTQSPTGSVTFQFTYASGMSCTLSGTLLQYGQLYTVPGTAYSCSDGLATTATMSEIKATSLGIEGRLSALTVGGGCREDATFSAAVAH